MQWLLACMGVSACLLAALALPETIHVRGIEKIISESRIACAFKKVDEEGGDAGRKERWVWVWMNPLRPIQLLRFPNVLAIVSSFYHTVLILVSEEPHTEPQLILRPSHDLWYVSLPDLSKFAYSLTSCFVLQLFSCL